MRRQKKRMRQKQAKMVAMELFQDYAEILTLIVQKAGGALWMDYRNEDFYADFKEAKPLKGTHRAHQDMTLWVKYLRERRGRWSYNP